MKTQFESSIYKKAIELDEIIKALIKENQIKNEINKVNLALNKKNTSLETAQSGNEINNNMMELKTLEMKIDSMDGNEEYSEDIEKLKQNISQLKRSFPKKRAKTAIRRNAKVLFTIVNDFINSMNADNLNNQFLKLEQLSSSRFDLTSLKTRKDFIINDYNRISSDLSDIRQKLIGLDVPAMNLQEDTLIKSYNDASDVMEVLAGLDNLLKDSNTSK